MDDDANSFFEQRRHVRLEAFSVATSTIGPDGQIAQILDVSQHGFRIQTEAQIREGDRLDLACDGIGSMHASVVWKRGSECGCEFETAIRSEAVSALLGNSLAITIQPRIRTIGSAAFRARGSVHTKAFSGRSIH